MGNNNKKMGSTTGKSVERFTELQLLLSSCIKDLIYLNDLLKNGGKLSNAVVDHVGNLLKKITGLKFKYDSNNIRFFYGHYMISFDESQLLTFKNIMDRLKECAQNQIFKHFNLVNVTDETITSIEALNCADIPVADNLSSIPFSRVASEAVLNDFKATRIIDNVKITSRNYRMFQVEPVSFFGDDLLMAPPWNDPRDNIPSISFQSWTSFIQVFRSILINFYAVFGSFDRIKSCEQCGNLFFEKKKTAGRFCGRICTKRNSDGPPDRYHCRMRQNRWLKYKYTFDKKTDISDLPERQSIQKADCGNCLVYPDSGECMKLREKNPDLFLQINTSKDDSE